MNIKESVPNFKIKLLKCSYNSVKRNKIRGQINDFPVAFTKIWRKGKERSSPKETIHPFIFHR